MKFATRVIRTPRASARLSRLEGINDPQTLASTFVEIHATHERREIAQPRASSLYDACMRKHVIGTIFHMYEVAHSGIKQHLLYGIGNAVHYWLQNSGDVFGDRRYGWWRCLACGTTRYFGKPPKKPCEHCKASAAATVYQEHGIILRKPLVVSGHPDMFCMSEEELLRVAEIKTMEGDAFDKLVAPVIDHVWQLQTYMWAAPLDKKLPVKIDSGVGYIFYVTKRGRKDFFPLKCFPVAWDRGLVMRIKEKLSLYTKGIEQYPKNLPAPIDECKDKHWSSWRAKNCVALQECMEQFECRKARGQDA